MLATPTLPKIAVRAAKAAEAKAQGSHDADIDGIDQLLTNCRRRSAFTRLLHLNAHATLRLGQIEAAMADWGSGYVTDKAYVHDFCRVQTPPMLALAALSGAVQAPGAASEALAYCDLGCV